jgi:hypothetical protein
MVLKLLKSYALAMLTLSFVEMEVMAALSRQLPS